MQLLPDTPFTLILCCEPSPFRLRSVIFKKIQNAEKNILKNTNYTKEEKLVQCVILSLNKVDFGVILELL